jgi:hypothetical protein
VTPKKVSRGAVLESLYQHRLLSSTQLHAMHWQDESARSTRRVLTALKDEGLVSMVRATDGGGSIHFLTPKGVETVEQVSNPAPKRKALKRGYATGPLRAHTLAVNEAAIAFMRAARERGDEFESPAWHHEIYHSTGPTKQDVVKADALLTYLQHGLGEEGRSSVLRYRLLELDRATEPTDKLATKPASYARLYRYTRANHRKPAWRARYDTFPAVICVVAGKKSAAALQRRVAAVLSLCDADPELRRTPQVEISFCLLGDLVERGPFAPIWQRPDSPDRYDWLGELASSANGEAAP